MPLRSMMRLAISSIEHSVVLIVGTPCRWNRPSAARTSNSHCAERRIAAAGSTTRCGSGAAASAIDRQAEQLLGERAQRRGQMLAFEIVLGQGVIGRENAVMHRHVDTRRRLTGPRDADQHDVGAAVVGAQRAVVGREREVRGVDARRVRLEIGDAVRPSLALRRLRAELDLERPEKCIEEIEQQTRCCA